MLYSPELNAGGVMTCLVPAIAEGMVAGLFYPALAGEMAPQITSAKTVYDACLVTSAAFLYLPSSMIAVRELSIKEP